MALSSTRIRMTGMSSGLDTATLIEDLMKSQRTQVNKIYRQKTEAEWKLEKYQDINTKLQDFTQKYMSALSKDNIMSERTYTAYKPNYTANSFFKVTASNSVIPDNYNVSATTMAKYASIKGSEIGQAISTSSTISEIASQLGVESSLDATGGLSFTVNGKQFDFESTDTIKDMMTEINGSDAGVKMYYSELYNTFSFQSVDMGANSKVEFANGTEGDAANFFGLSTLSAQGTNASITINGRTIEKDSNTFSIDGMSFQITGDFTSADVPGGYGLTFTQDADGVYEKVKGFIDEYNKLYEEIYNLTKEEKFYEFDPLIQEEKDEMKEDEIKLWEEKARSGIMRNDVALSGLLTELRSAAYSIVGDTGMMAANIGITTSGKEGKLQIDEEKFKKAINENPEQVAQIMAQTSTATDATQKNAESGFVAKLNNVMNNYRMSIRANQIQQYTTRIYNIDLSIKEQEERLLKKEEFYWNKYTSLETLMTNLNGQSDWLTQQLAYL